MLQIYVTVTTLLTTTAGRAQHAWDRRRRDDRGSVTLETVAIALGLFLLAGLVVGAIGVAVKSRLDQIK